MFSSFSLYLTIVGKGPFPAVIDMFGGVGNLVEIRAALLASRGFLTLALGYLAYKDLPSTLDWLTSVKIIHYFKVCSNRNFTVVEILILRLS